MAVRTYLWGSDWLKCMDMVDSYPVCMYITYIDIYLEGKTMHATWPKMRTSRGDSDAQDFLKGKRGRQVSQWGLCSGYLATTRVFLSFFCVCVTAKLIDPRLAWRDAFVVHTATGCESDNFYLGICWEDLENLISRTVLFGKVDK